MTTPLPRSTDSVPEVGSLAQAAEPTSASATNEQRTTRFRMAPRQYRQPACDRDEIPVRRLLAAGLPGPREPLDPVRANPDFMPDLVDLDVAEWDVPRRLEILLHRVPVAVHEPLARAGFDRIDRV